MATVVKTSGTNTKTYQTVDITKTLKFGMTDPQIMNLQKILVNLGLLTVTTPTNYFGSATRKAVQDFQCAQKIACSGSETSNGFGLVGKMTMTALNKASESSENLVTTPTQTNSTQQNIQSTAISTSTTTFPIYLTKTLSLGQTNDEIKTLQQKLIFEKVYSGPVTGYFGQLTMTGVKEYQKKYGIQQTGSVGPLTRKAMEK